MRGVTPALVVCFIGVAMMIGSAILISTSPPPPVDHINPPGASILVKTKLPPLPPGQERESHPVIYARVPS